MWVATLVPVTVPGDGSCAGELSNHLLLGIQFYLTDIFLYNK